MNGTCEFENGSSRVCERGTWGCVVNHDRPEEPFVQTSPGVYRDTAPAQPVAPSVQPMSNVKQCSDAATSSHKPCPFCGGHPEIFNYERGYASFVYVLCTKCGARTKAVRFPTYNNCPGDLTLTCAERDAFKLWDDRHCPVPELTEGERR